MKWAGDPCMDERDQRELRAYPEAREKVFYLGTFSSSTDANMRPLTIPDPWSRPAEEFRACYRDIVASVDGLAAALKDLERTDMSNPAFLITIDTEGDDIWGGHATVTTENTRFLPRFQNFCRDHGFPPTYLTNYEMAIDPRYQEFGRSVLRAKEGEIGLHVHPWNSPPLAATGPETRRRPRLSLRASG